MTAFMILALGACVVWFLAGLSEVWAAPISRPEPEASREPVKPQLPPEVIASLNRNTLRHFRLDHLLDQDPPKATPVGRIAVDAGPASS
jgi:hypothetical protein